MSAMPLTAETFEQTVQEHPIVLVDWWASWCGPCRQFAPVYEAAAQANTDIYFGSVDTETERELASGAQISSIPTLMAFKEGSLVFSRPGALPAAALDELISAIRALDMETVRSEFEKES